MSVYKPHHSRLWLYDFQHKGQRFHGPTGQTSQRAAEAYERRLRAQLAEGGASAIQQTKETSPREMTLDTAAGKWWREKGSGLRSAVDQERHVQDWLELLGKNKRLGQIRLSTLRTAIAKRRAWGYRGKLPQAATINRFIAALRMVLNYVDDEDDPLPSIKWRKLTITENNKRVREMTDAQYEAVIAAADKRALWGGLFVDVLATYGPRMGEMFIAPSTYQGPRWIVPKEARKQPVDLTITLLPEHAALLAARASRALAADLPHIWYDEKKTKLAPVSRHRANYVVRKAIEDAGLVDFHIHDMRHHAATRLRRAANGDLGIVQAALGHASIQSTQRYAHVQEADLRAAFARLSRNSPEAGSSSEGEDQAPLGKAERK